MKRTIMLVDDDVVPMAPYKTALEKSGYLVRTVAEADEAMALLMDKTEQFDIVLLDVMMPPGSAFGLAETDEGMRTGVFLYRGLRRCYPTLPVIVLTNVQDNAILAMFPKEDLHLSLLHKYDHPPFELVEFIKNVLR